MATARRPWRYVAIIDSFSHPPSEQNYRRWFPKTSLGPQYQCDTFLRLKLNGGEIPPRETGKLGGQDKHSVVADPQFTDAAKHDYTLQPGSPALKLGFQQIEISKVGPRPDAAVGVA